MGLFKNVLNQLMEQVNLVSLSPEEKKLDSILKQAAKDASVILIPTENKGVYDVNVTLENGKSISYYGKLRYSYGWERLRYLNGGIEDDKPYVNVSFVSNAFDNKEIQDSIIKDVIEWRRNEYGNQYNTHYVNIDENEIYFFIMGEGCFGKIPAIPDKYDSFKYADILEEFGEVEADKRFCEFLSKKLSGYTSVMIKSLEYSLGSGHKWPTKDDIIARQKAQAAKEAAERLAQAQRARNYPSTMKRIMADAVKQINWEFTPQAEKNAFQIGDYAEGCFSLKHSTDYKNPSVDIEFISREFENSEKTNEMVNVIVNSGLLSNFDAYTRSDNTIFFKKTIAIQNIDDEQTAASNIKDGIDTLINAVITIRDKWQRWPTKAEVEARHREQAAREAERIAKARQQYENDYAQAQSSMQSTTGYSSTNKKDDAERKAREKAKEYERKHKNDSAIESLKNQIAGKQREIERMRETIKNNPNNKATKDQCRKRIESLQADIKRNREQIAWLKQ